MVAYVNWNQWLTQTQTDTQTTLHCHHIVPGGLHPPGTKTKEGEKEECLILIISFDAFHTR